MRSTTRGDERKYPLRALAALDCDAESFHVAQRPELGDAEFDPRRFELLHDDFRDAFAGLLEQQEVQLPEQPLGPVHDFAVIDGVGDFAAVRRVLSGQTDLEVELYRLRHLL